jgi:hypothetical protein
MSRAKSPFQCASRLCPSNAFHRTVIPQCFVVLLFDRLLAVGPVKWNEGQCNSLSLSLLSSAPSPHCSSQTLSCLARINSLASGQSHFLAVGRGPRCRGTATTKGYTAAPPLRPFHELSQGYQVANFGCLRVASLFLLAMFFLNHRRCLSGCGNAMQRHGIKPLQKVNCLIRSP